MHVFQLRNVVEEAQENVFPELSQNQRGLYASLSHFMPKESNFSHFTSNFSLYRHIGPTVKNPSGDHF